MEFESLGVRRASLCVFDVIRESVGVGLQLIVEIQDLTLQQGDIREVALLGSFPGCSMSDATLLARRPPVQVVRDALSFRAARRSTGYPQR